jgi:hypothetical protein
MNTTTTTTTTTPPRLAWKIIIGKRPVLIDLNKTKQTPKKQ